MHFYAMASGAVADFDPDQYHKLTIRVTGENPTTATAWLNDVELASEEDTSPLLQYGSVAILMRETTSRVAYIHCSTEQFSAGFEPWAIGNVNARYVKAKLDHDNLTHGPAILDSFTLLVDMQDQAYKYPGIAVPAGGMTYTFPRGFHKPPFVTAQANSNLDLTIGRSNVTETTVDLIVYQAGVSVAAVVDLIVEGA